MLYHLNNEISNQAAPTEKRKFIRKCPVTDCRGFLSSQWKCEVCENKICHECNEIKNDEHTCLPENVETMKLLKKDTKPCPKCGTMIFKISGCAQMWCPDCHTAFNWNTMVIEKGVIHNPHFFDFQRLGGAVARNPGDIPCGGIPTAQDLYKACNLDVRRWRGFAPPETKCIFDFCQLVTHLERVEMNNRRAEENNLELRLKYLSNDLSEDGYKNILQKNEKAREKTRDINNIIDMFVHTGSDILRQFVNKDLSVEQIKEIIENLINYSNDTLQVISKRYSCVVPQINISTFEVFRQKLH
jgi:hypothetical protein